MPNLTITVKGLKVTTLLPPSVLAEANLVPPEPQPPGNPVIILHMEGGCLVTVKLNGKSVRKVVKFIAEHGPDGVNVLLQGNLKVSESGDFIMDAAGIMATPRVAKSVESGEKAEV